MQGRQADRHSLTLGKPPARCQGRLPAALPCTRVLQALVCFCQQLAVQLCVSQHASMGLPYGNTKLRNGGWVVRCLSAKGGDCPPFGSCRLCGLGLFPCEVVKPTYLSACCLLCAFRPHSVQRSTRRESTPLPFQLLMFMF